MSPYFKDEHHMFRSALREYLQKEFASRFPQWEKDQQIPKDVWENLGTNGYLGLCHEEKYGGLDADWFTHLVFCEELGRTLNNGFAAAVCVHEFMATHHIAQAGNHALKEKFLVPAIKGEKIAALGMSEPHTGSDLKNIRTTAERMNGHYKLSGSKIFITNGYYGDYISLCARTDKGLSLFAVDLHSKGISRNKLEKVGWYSSDTAEIFLDEVMVPEDHLIGEEGRAFYYMAESLQAERLVLSMISLGIAERTLEITKEYLQERKAFGQELKSFQTLRHKMADLHTELEAARQLVYHTTWMMEEGYQTVRECSMCKLLTAKLQNRVADECLQMFGGYGYMEEYPIAQVYRDARAAPIIGGTSEIMRQILAKMILDGKEYKKVYKT